jgi:exodeoxyribonuclease VIII
MNAPTTNRGMSNAEYHALPSISKSGLDLIHRAPALYKWRRENRQDPTPAMRLGTLTHTAVLEPERFAAEVMVAPKIDRRTSAGKAEWQAFQIEAEGRELIAADEMEKLLAIRDSVHAHPAAFKALFGNPTIEQSIFWTDPATGVDCRCRPDCVTAAGVIVDLKTCRDASPAGFAKSIAQYRYHVQAAFYSDGYAAAFGEPPRGFVFIAVETEPPYLVGVYVSSAAMVDRGRIDYHADLETFRECLATDTWPGYSTSPLTLDLPKWV